MGNTNPLSNLFGKSPFKPMQQHMRLVTECAGEIPGLYEALGNQDTAKIEEIKTKIFSLENQADDIKNEVRARLPKSLFMPVDRRDLLELLDLQDTIADTAQDIAGLLVERKMEIPVGMGEPLSALAKKCVEACNMAATIIEGLDELVEMGFGGRESTRIMGLVTELSQIENETDTLAMDLSRSLYSHEDKMQPVSVMFWYQLINWTANLADNAEKVGDRLRLFTAR